MLISERWLVGPVWWRWVREQVSWRWLWIECEFTALRYFTLDGSDYPSHPAQETAIARYIRWRNKHANLPSVA